MQTFQVNFPIMCRVARDKGSDTGADEANPFWWCDSAQAGYGAFLFQGIKDWCAENSE